MKFPQTKFVNIMLAFALITMASVMVGLGQKSAVTLNEKTDVLLAESASLEQCRNGSSANPVGCVTIGGATGWVTGNAGDSNSHWAENQFLPYRMLFSGLQTGGAVSTVIIGYDRLHSGVNAIDYLGTYNATETNINACVGVDFAFCSGPGSIQNGTIPPDPLVTGSTNPNTGGFISQTPGTFTIWGGTIQSVVYDAILPSDGTPPTERRIVVTFIPTVANPVLAWGGHVAWVGDWGAGNAAGGLSGSPYHMRLISLNGSGGNQDRSLSAAAVVPSGAVFIKKVVSTLDRTDGSTVAFSFTASSNFNPLSFGLVDDNAGPGVDTKQSTEVLLFGAGNAITVTETNIPAGWTLLNVNCVDTVGLPDSTQNSQGPTATIIVSPYEIVTCTFSNSQFAPTAAPASVSGRVMDSFGNGIGGVRLSISDAQTGDTWAAISNPFGYYTLVGPEAGNFYIISIASKRYSFADDTRTLTLNEDVVGYDWVANP